MRIYHSVEIFGHPEFRMRTDLNRVIYAETEVGMRTHLNRVIYITLLRSVRIRSFSLTLI
jgi:hypothetical protein